MKTHVKTKQNLTKLCCTLTFSFVLTQLLAEYNIHLIERIDTSNGAFAIIECSNKMLKEISQEFKHQTEHNLIIL